MRLHLYVSHSFDHAEKHERIIEFVRGENVPIADFSVPVWRQIAGDEDAVKAAIADRIWRSNRVLVLITDEIHKSPYIEFEVRVAKELGKPIIGVYPNGDNEGPIPRFLDGSYYRMVGWRRGSMAKALLGEYPPDRRVFDIAEVEERRELITTVGLAAGVVSLIVAGATAVRFKRLKHELAAKGIHLVGDDGSGLLDVAAPRALAGVGIGALAMAVLVGTPKAITAGAMIGGGIGAAVGVHKYYSLRIEMLGKLTKLELTPSSATPEES